MKIIILDSLSYSFPWLIKKRGNVLLLSYEKLRRTKQIYDKALVDYYSDNNSTSPMDTAMSIIVVDDLPNSTPWAVGRFPNILLLSSTMLFDLEYEFRQALKAYYTTLLRNEIKLLRGMPHPLKKMYCYAKHDLAKGQLPELIRDFSNFKNEPIPHVDGPIDLPERANLYQWAIKKQKARRA